MTRPLLHDYFRSSACYRVRILLNLKGVDYDRHSVNLAEGAQKDPAYRALNPQGFVPMLEIDGLKLTQSLSIAVYLDQTRPEPLLMPRDPADGAHVRALALQAHVGARNGLRPIARDEDFGQMVPIPVRCTEPEALRAVGWQSNSAGLRQLRDELRAFLRAALTPA